MKPSMVAFLDELVEIEKHASAPVCKKCGGRGRDTRSGVCDRCAFEKLSSGFMQNLGTKAVNAAKAVGRVPGQLGGMAENFGKGVAAFGTPGQSLKNGWRTTVTDSRAMPTWQKALMGASLIGGAREAALKEDPSGQGRSRLHRVFRFAGDQVGSVMTAPFGFGGSVAGSMIGGKAGDLAGRAVDKVRGYKRQIAPGKQQSDMVPAHAHVRPHLER